MTQDVVLSVKNLKVEFPQENGDVLKAVRDVSFDLRRGETLGIVGESGCGKSTLAKTIMRLNKAKSGEVLIDGKDFLKLKPRELWHARRQIQMIFQDPFSSLDPRQTVGSAVMEPMKVYKLYRKRSEYEARAKKLFDMVGLSSLHMNRFPHEFSGGQLQRVGIARALALKPSILVADEPVSSLDVSIQAQVSNLLKDLQQELNLSILFIAHDLSVVRYMSHEIAVMYLGKMVELQQTEKLCQEPKHPYTRLLLSSMLHVSPKVVQKPFEVDFSELPSATNIPSGCHFHPRCQYAKGSCSEETPNSVALKTGFVQCHHPVQ